MNLIPLSRYNLQSISRVSADMARQYTILVELNLSMYVFMFRCDFVLCFKFDVLGSKVDQVILGVYLVSFNPPSDAYVLGFDYRHHC